MTEIKTVIRGKHLDIPLAVSVQIGACDDPECSHFHVIFLDADEKTICQLLATKKTFFNIGKSIKSIDFKEFKAKTINARTVN